MSNLIQTILQAESQKKAVAHFNIGNLEFLTAVGSAARELNLPVIIGVSEGERDFIGVRRARDLVDSVKAEFDLPIFLNADHTYSLERVKEAIDAGYDSVIYDGAKLTLEENIAATKECVTYAKSTGKAVLIEAELGYIGTSSKLLDELPENATVSAEQMPTPEQAIQFVTTTGVDLLAPAVGNIHGMLKNAPNPKLNIELISKIRQAAGVPLVLHGGSGTSDEDFKAAITAGIGAIHVSTELRLAYRTALQKSLTDNPDELSPYKYLAPTIDAVKQVVTSRLRLFNGL